MEEWIYQEKGKDGEKTQTEYYQQLPLGSDRTQQLECYKCNNVQC